jgi:hypothetical protein
LLGVDVDAFESPYNKWSQGVPASAIELETGSPLAIEAHASQQVSTRPKAPTRAARRKAKRRSMVRELRDRDLTREGIRQELKTRGFGDFSTRTIADDLKALEAESSPE